MGFFYNCFHHLLKNNFSLLFQNTPLLASNMTTRINKIKRQISFRNLRRRLASGRSNSESSTMLEGENDVDHLLENCEPPDIQKDSNSDSIDSENNRNNKKNLSDTELDKYKIPSSIIVLNDEDKSRLEYVLLQIGLREVGLG